LAWPEFLNIKEEQKWKFIDSGVLYSPYLVENQTLDITLTKYSAINSFSQNMKKIGGEEKPKLLYTGNL
jgi:hypothetical protein